MANKIAMLSFQMTVIIPCHAWAKSKHIHSFYIYVCFFQREDPFLPSRYREKDALNNLLLKLLAQCLCTSIPIQTPFDFFWAFRECMPCWLYGTTKAKSKSCQDLSLSMMWYKRMQWIKMCFFDRSLYA